MFRLCKPLLTLKVLAFPDVTSSLAPFLSALQTSANIEGISIPGRHIITCPSYADNVTLTLMGHTSVQQAFSLLRYFEKASALKLNMEKTHGLYCSRLPSTNQFPSIAWTDEHIRLLGVVIGKSSSVSREWNEVLSNFKKSTKHLSSYQTTFNAKSLLSKTKLLPLITYTSNTYPLTTRLRREINESIENFVSRNANSIIPITTLMLPTHLGGYTVANIPIYCDLIFLKPIYEYCKHRKNDTQPTPQTSFIEYHIGQQLSRQYNLPFRNYLPHSLLPNTFYSCALSLCKKYRFTFDQRCRGQVKPLYNTLVTSNMNSTNKHMPYSETD